MHGNNIRTSCVYSKTGEPARLQKSVEKLVGRSCRSNLFSVDIFTLKISLSLMYNKFFLQYRKRSKEIAKAKLTVKTNSS